MGRLSGDDDAFPAQHPSIPLACNRGDANTNQLASNVANVFLPAEPTIARRGGARGRTSAPPRRWRAFRGHVP
jgi:hypothetical protein